ncbi:MAG: hypothetical protein LBS34_02285 [Rickettsiales bacterium]|nr:hypothetical protein [Rickettsiales bacterium]
MEEVQKLLYNKLIASTSEHIGKLANISSSPEKNSTFPYLLMVINNVNTEINFNNSKYLLTLAIKIFDKNESNIDIISIADAVQTELLELSGTITSNNYEIIGMYLADTAVGVFNEINSVWNINLNFKILVGKMNQ